MRCGRAAQVVAADPSAELEEDNVELEDNVVLEDNTNTTSDNDEDDDDVEEMESDGPAMEVSGASIPTTTPIPPATLHHIFVRCPHYNKVRQFCMEMAMNDLKCHKVNTSSIIAGRSAVSLHHKIQRLQYALLQQHQHDKTDVLLITQPTSNAAYLARRWIYKPYDHNDVQAKLQYLPKSKYLRYHEKITSSIAKHKNPQHLHTKEYIVTTEYTSLINMHQYYHNTIAFGSLCKHGAAGINQWMRKREAKLPQSDVEACKLLFNPQGTQEYKCLVYLYLAYMVKYIFINDYTQ